MCFHFELLPRWALVVLAARELFMLVLSQVGLRKGMDLKINMVGRWAVWPVMFAIFLTLLTDTWVAEASLYLGLALTLWATVHLRAGRGALSQSLKLDLTPGSILAVRRSGPLRKDSTDTWTPSPTSALSPTRSSRR